MIRDTATSTSDFFFIEVMGRDAGFLALNGAIASERKQPSYRDLHRGRPAGPN